MAKRPFTTKGYRAKKCLKLVHTNLCGSFNVNRCGGYEYFITFMDDYSRFGYVYLMHRKFNVLDKIIEFKVELKNNWVNLSRHFNLIEVVSICLLSSILSFRIMIISPS